MRKMSVLVFVVLLAATASAQWVDTTLNVAAGPFRFCYNSQNDKVYCACWASDNVVVIDGATNAIIVSLGVGDEPHDLCYNPQDDKAYTANFDGNSVTVIRAGSGIEEMTHDEVRMTNAGASIIRNTLFLSGGGNSTLNIRTSQFGRPEDAGASARRKRCLGPSTRGVFHKTAVNIR